MKNFNFKNLVEENPKLTEQMPNVRALVANNNARYREYAYYFRKKISLAGNQKLVESATVKAFGVTNLDSGKIIPGRAFMITGLALRYAYNASTTTAYAQVYSNAIYNPIDVAADATDQDANTAGVQSSPAAVALVPTQLTDSEFELSVGGKGMFGCQTGDFLVDNLYTEKLRGARELRVELGDFPIIVDDTKVIEPWLYFNENISSPSNNHFIEFVMYGQEIFA